MVVGGAAEKANVRVGQRNVIIPTKENTTIGVFGIKFFWKEKETENTYNEISLYSSENGRVYIHKNEFY